MKDNELAWRDFVSKIEITDHQGISDLAIDLSKHINILVGGNGSGKSRILRATYDAIVSGEMRIEDKVTIQVKRSEQTDLEATFVNLAKTSEIYKDYFCGLNDIEENLLNGIGAITIEPGDLEEINYILCRNYTYVSYYETQPALRIGGADAADNIFSEDFVPFFKVVESNVEWDTRKMGAGEYAALYLWWVIKAANPKSFLFIEEPEALLSYRVQERLMDFLVVKLWEKKLFSIISTHSLPFIARVPDSCIKALVRRGCGTKQSTIGKNEILRHISAPIDARAVILTEDEFAKQFTSSFFNKYFPQYSGKLKVVAVSGSNPNGKSGASGIMGILDALRNAVDFPLRVAGLYDGDQYNQPTYTSPNIAQCIRALLPRKESLDRDFDNICRDNIDKFDEYFPGFSEELALHEGSDPHDLLRRIAEGIKVDVRSIWKKCFEIWTCDHGEEVDLMQNEFTSILKKLNILQ